jgi:hypothetical protein
MFEKALEPTSVPANQPVAPVIQPSKIASVEVPKSLLPPSKPAKKS